VGDNKVPHPGTTLLRFQPMRHCPSRALICLLFAIVLAPAGPTLASSGGSRVLPFGTPPQGSAPIPPPPPVPKLPAGIGKAMKLLRVINRDREGFHAPPLLLDLSQSMCSLQHSRHMARMGSISHDQFPSDLCTVHVAAAENVGMASGEPLEALLTLHHMMMSEGACPRPSCPGVEREVHGHYVNLINRAYRRVGIGIYTTNGTTWLTEDFVG
jgi:Cysteine-rich secretory protein family